MPYFFYPLSGLFNALMAAALGSFIYTRNPADRRYRTYGAFCLSLFVWGIAYFLWLISDQASVALFWSRVLMAGAVFLPVTSYHHVIQLLEVSSVARNRIVTVGYFATF